MKKKNRHDRIGQYLHWVIYDHNISFKEFKKFIRYKDLQKQIEKMWHLKATNIIVLVGALEMIKKGIEKFLNMLP